MIFYRFPLGGNYTTFRPDRHFGSRRKQKGKDFDIHDEKEFEIWEDSIEPHLVPAEIINYEDKLEKAIHDILEMSFRREEPKKFFRKVVEVGADTLDAKCCSIFLLEEKTSLLRLMDASGDMGEKLKKAEPMYPIAQKRGAFTKDERETNKDKIKSIVQRYRQGEQKVKTELDRREFLKKRKSWIDDDDLPMGITASVVKKEKGVIAHGIAVREHPEWLGAYESAQREICTSIIEVPLKTKEKQKGGGEVEKIIGLIKIENHKESPVITNFEDLKDEEKRSEINIFGLQHRQIISILADSVALATKGLYGEESYKNIFGIKALNEVIDLLSSSINGSKNKKVAELMRDFCKDTIKWDIIGVDNCYQRVIELVGKILKELDLSEKLIEIYKKLRGFDVLLGATDVSYREHFLHQFQVFLSGYCIINKNGQIQRLLIDYLRKRGLSNSDVDDVVTCWFLASIVHDLAYSIERINRWLGSYIGVMFPPPYGQKTTKKPEELIKELQLTIPWGNIFSIYDGVFDYHKTALANLICERVAVELRKKGFSKNINRDVMGLVIGSLVGYQDHGLFGGLILMHIMEGETNPIIANEASLAIAMHSPKFYKQLKKLQEEKLKKEEKIYPQDFPFAFLLMFCDNAQQWGRPQIMELLVRGTETEKIKIKLIKMEIPPDQGSVNFQLKYSRLTEEILEKILEPWKNWEKFMENINMTFTIGYSVGSVEA